MSSLGELPARWRSDPLLVSEQGGRADVLAGDDQAVLVALHGRTRVALLGRGAPERAAGLLAVVVGADPVAEPVQHATWLSLPRGSEPSAATLGSLGLSRVSGWDWMLARVAPDPVEGQQRVRRLDPNEQAAAIRRCLAEANPGTSADPAGPWEAGWWGIEGPDGLLGVIGAGLRHGDPDGADRSWHLHGLGVAPQARRRGLGAALTAVATVDGLASGVDWVSLGLYAHNDSARRVYHRLGFGTLGEFDSYGPPGARHH